MRSSSGAHYIALDHVRALAAFMVVTWHFIHASNGYPVPFEGAPTLFILSLLDEGHTGVALFMTLSGYLFAKLLDGKTIRYPMFLWNRVLRLLPLLLLVLVIVGVNHVVAGQNVYAFIQYALRGVIFPALPNGGWSITVELHFYLVLPVLLWLARKSQLLPFLIVVTAVLLRFFFYQRDGSVQWLAYWTIFGRIDQFVLGILVYHFRSYIARRHLLFGVIFLCFTLFYWGFAVRGGFYQMPSYPSSNAVWIVLPTIEGLVYALAIAWYETSFSFKASGISSVLGLMGRLSYSIYLIHPFFVFHSSRFVHEHIMDISNFYLACVWSFVFFVLMLPVGYLSFRFVELPFLKYRRSYIVPPANAGNNISSSAANQRL